jgi:hypothetical protein
MRADEHALVRPAVTVLKPVDVLAVLVGHVLSL